MGLKRQAKALALRFGVELGRFDPARSPSVRRRHAIERAEIDVVLDVGANTGQYAMALRESGYEGRIISFEPLADAYAELAAKAARDPRWETHQLAAGSEAGTATMQIAGNSVSSSLLPMNPTHVAILPASAPTRVEDVRVERLDHVVSGMMDDRERPLLKLDLQGYELNALKGMAGLLPRVEVVEVELSLVELYVGAPTLLEVFGYLTQRGFRCVGLDQVFGEPTTGFMLQVDGLFVREPGEPGGGAAMGRAMATSRRPPPCV